MADESLPRPPGPPDEEPLRALVHEPRIRELLFDALVGGLDSPRSPSPWRRVPSPQQTRSADAEEPPG